MSVEERLARLEEAVRRIDEYVRSQLNHFNFYQKLILVLLAAILTMLGLQNITSKLLP